MSIENKKNTIPLIKGRKKAPNGYTTCEDKYVRNDMVVFVGGNPRYIGDCVQGINGEFIYKKDPNVVRDYFNPEIYIDRASSLKPKAFISGKDNNGKFIIGYTYDSKALQDSGGIIPKPGFKSQTTIDDFYENHGITNEEFPFSRLLFLNLEIALDCGAFEHYASGNLYIGDTKWVKSKLSETPARFQSFENNYKLFNNPDNSKSSSYIKTGGLGYTFGVELETSEGLIPSYIRPYLDIECVRDGSVTGGEYVTGVLKGTRGINHLDVICDQLNKRCKVDTRTGVHVHIGGANFNKEFSIFTVMLAKLIEDDLFESLPNSRRGNQFCEYLGLSDEFQNYKELFKSLNPKQFSKLQYKEFMENEFGNLFYKMSKRYMSDNFNRKKTHPGGRYTGGAGSGSFRYKWINLIPCNFMRIRSSKGEQDYTLEFRCLEGSLNFSDIHNWILICMAFVACIENHKSKILNYLIQDKKMTLKELVAIVYDKALTVDKSSLVGVLHEYIDRRMSKNSVAAKKKEKLDEMPF